MQFTGNVDLIGETFIEALLLDAGYSRTAFGRMEKDARLILSVATSARKEFAGGEVVVSGLEDERRVPLQALPSKGAVRLEVPIDTVLKPGAYACKVECRDASGQPVGQAMELDVNIIPRPLPWRLPAIAWAWLGEQAFEDLGKIGFTHFLTLWQSSTSFPIEYVPKEKRQAARHMLDRAYASGLRAMASISIRTPAFRKKYGRVEKSGKATERLNGLFPEVQAAWHDVGAFIGGNFGDLPAFEGAMIGSETRDLSQPSFDRIDLEAWKKASGLEMPPEVELSRRVHPSVAETLPADGIVPENHPVLQYYRWFWKEGDGWNGLYSAATRGLKEAGRPDLWTWHDPAVRVPALWGSGGGVDVLSNWAYTYPDPVKVAMMADELFAMAKGNGRQGVMSMTQIIWYRSQTTSAAAPGKPVHDWEKENPDARFITIAPDHLSEALWLQLSYPIQGLMYHGWGSLLGSNQGNGYELTNRAAAERLAELTRNVVTPLGPTLRQVPDRPADVAFLQGYASQIFAGRGTYGWGRGWGADAYLVARHAALQPEIIYEETVQRDGLDGYRVVILPHCDFLTGKTAAALRSFQQRGGIIVADEFLAPGLQPDIVMQSFARASHATRDYAVLLERAAALRRELDPFYRRRVDSDNPQVVVRERSLGNADYVFAINDHRTFGDYVGHHELVMEKGVPSRAFLTLWRRKGVVYDLMRHRAVAAEADGAGLRVPVELEAGGGALYLVLDEPVGDLQIEAPAAVSRGRKAEVAIRLLGRRGGPVPAVIPMHVEIRDPNGAVAEYSGHYGTRDGALSLQLDFASNDAVREWAIEVREGVTGQKLRRTFKLVSEADFGFRFETIDSITMLRDHLKVVSSR